MRYPAMVLAATLLLAAAPGALGGEGDKRVNVLYIGCLARSPPFRDMRSDPLFSMSFVQATLRDWAGMPTEEVHRMVRMYMPRTEQILVEEYDAIVLANSNRMAVGPHIEKLARAVSEGGLGLLMSGGWETFGGTGYSEPPWGETSVGGLLPTKDVIGKWEESGRLVIDEPEHELIRSIPWNMRDPVLASPIRWHHNPVTLKPGARQLSHVVARLGQEDPLMVEWALPGGTRVFALTSEIHALSWYGSPWEYALDFGSNLMIYLDGRPVPQDIGLVHSARSKIFEIETRRSLFVSLLDFCESFGANTRRLLARGEEIDAVIAEAVPYYLDLHFEEMLEAYRTVESMLEEMELDAVELKNRTLLWVYVIEWLAVSGTGMAGGFVLWSLMVRRTFYREVRVTKFLEPDW
jgi:hypothetical protein